MNAEQNQSLHSKVGRAGLWVAIRQVAVRGLAIVQLLLLARILTPAEFGLFAIAMMVYAFIEAMTFLGFGHALIQRKTVDPLHLNTLFVVNIGRGVLLGLLVYATSAPATWLMNSTESQPLVATIGILPLVMGFHNPAMILFQKELRMKQELAFYLSGALANLGISLALALHGFGTWALISGLIAQSLTQLVASYIIQSYRPALQFSKACFGEMFDFSKWLMASQGLKYLSNNLPSWVIGHYLGVQTLGLYHVAGRFSQAIGSEFMTLISTVAFPAFSKMQDDKERLADAYIRSQKIVLSASFLIFGLIIALSKDFVYLFLGEAWLGASSLINLLALLALVQAIGTQAEMLKAVNKTKLIFQLSFLRLIIVSILIIPAVNSFGAEGAIWAIIISPLVLSPIGQMVILKSLSIRIFAYFQIMMPPISAFLLIILGVYLNNYSEKNILGFAATTLATLAAYMIVLILFDRILKTGIGKQWVGLLGTITRP